MVSKGLNAVLFAGTLLLAGGLMSSNDPSRVQTTGPAAWAYPLNPTPPKLVDADNGAILHVPQSRVGIRISQIHDRFEAIDWHPEAHPAMPAVVAHGRKPDLFACAFCHYPNGQGRPENASLAGLPAAYIVAQMKAMRDGSRKSAQPAMIAPRLMLQVAAHIDGSEVAQAAAYYARLTYQPWVRVVETDKVPHVVVRGVSAYVAATDGAQEPIGGRIVEIPENSELTRLRDDASGYVAYVPPGAIARGRDLASKAAGDRLPCAICHGPGLQGATMPNGTIVPPLAGRSPSYLYRQLFDIQAGVRSGVAAAPMAREVSALTSEQMRDLVAYIASLTPASARNNGK